MRGGIPVHTLAPRNTCKPCGRCDAPLEPSWAGGDLPAQDARVAECSLHEGLGSRGPAPTSMPLWRASFTAVL